MNERSVRQPLVDDAVDVFAVSSAASFSSTAHTQHGVALLIGVECEVVVTKPGGRVGSRELPSSSFPAKFPQRSNVRLTRATESRPRERPVHGDDDRARAGVPGVHGAGTVVRTLRCAFECSQHPPAPVR